MRRVDGEDLADDEPVEQHADRGQVLLAGRIGRGALFYCPVAGLRDFQRLDVGSDMQRLDIDELADAMLFQPDENDDTAR
jgi:hypothetical protein